MNKVLQAAAELQNVCQSQGWQFCFIGGVALQRWSEPRETIDVDISLFTGFGQEHEFSEVLLRHFEPRISKAAEFALAYQEASCIGITSANNSHRWLN